MAVDPGEKRLGIAISDPSGTIANPLMVIQHVARLVDATTIAQLASVNQVVLIVVGQPLDSDGNIGPAARKASRLADAIRSQTDIPVVLWDESGSTCKASKARLKMGSSRRKDRSTLDALAATVILQDFLDANTAKV
jgi:putative Holliday junction resolvase